MDPLWVSDLAIRSPIVNLHFLFPSCIPIWDRRNWISLIWVIYFRSCLNKVFTYHSVLKDGALLWSLSPVKALILLSYGQIDEFHYATTILPRWSSWGWGSAAQLITQVCTDDYSCFGGGSFQLSWRLPLLKQRIRIRTQYDPFSLMTWESEEASQQSDKNPVPSFDERCGTTWCTAPDTTGLPTVSFPWGKRIPSGTTITCFMDLVSSYSMWIVFSVFYLFLKD